MPFQICSSRLFLTYPECNVPKQELYDYLNEKFNPEEIIVAEEKHQNGHPHLHAYLKLRETYRTRDPRFADYANYHGNYQGCRSAKNVARYVTKGDDYISNVDVATLLGQPGAQKKILGAKLIAGESLVKIVEDAPQLLFGYKRLKEDLETYLRDKLEQDSECDLPDEVPNPWGLRLPVDTDNKKCHFWFWSARPNKGKTTGVILPLVRDYRAVVIDPKATYHEVRKTTKIICIDEIKRGAIDYAKLNRWCDGFGKFRVFMLGDIELNQKPLIVVCSNFSIDEVFPFRNDLVHARFIEYDVSNLDFI